MRPTFISAVTLAATLTALPTLAQDAPDARVTPPATAGQEQGNPQLQQAEQRLQQAAERLQQAAQSGDRQAVDQAKQEAQQALEAVRQAMGQVPADQRQQVQQRADSAEEALRGPDANAGAQAVIALVDVIGLVAVPVEAQGAQILVEQAAPQVMIQRSAPQVTVQRQQPEILVRQPAPTVTVDIPQPEIIVRMPEPEVTVSQAQPQVQIRQSEPQVAVVPAEPQVRIDPAKPQVEVQQLADAQPNVQVEGAQQPRIQYERAEPRVIVNQPQGQPQIRVEGMQGEQQAAPAQQAALTDQPAQTPADRDPISALRGEQIVGRVVYGSAGEEIGEVENVVIGRQGGPAAVVGVGGFLGIGERDVAIPIDQLGLGRGDRLTTVLTRDQIGSLRSYDASAYEPMDRARTFGQTIDG